MSTPTPPQPRLFSRRAELVAVVAFWCILGALSLLRRALDPRGPDGLTSPALFVTLAEYTLWAALTPAIFILARRFPLERERWGRHVLILLGIALVGAALVELFRLFILFPLFYPEGFGPGQFGGRRRPFGPGRGPFGLTPRDALTRLLFLDEFVVFVAVLAAGFARDYFLRYREREARTAQLEAQLAEARLSALRMQLNPHFLFNTLHAVSALVERDPAGVRLIVARLSALLRHVLDGASSAEVPLRDELAFLRLYLDIQRVRFQDRLVVEEDIAPEALDALVPSLLLQPLVENAVEHGVGQVVDEAGRVVLRARVQTGTDGAEQLVLTVRDNGPGPTDVSESRTGVGLANTEARLDARYGDAAHFHLGPSDAGGAEATVVLPYHTARDVRAAR